MLALSAPSGLAMQALPPVPEPAENPITEGKRVLGKILFWDEQLSSDNTMACGTCHIPAAGGADPRITAHPGPDGLFGTGDDVVGSAGVIRSDVNNAYLPDASFDLDVQVTGRAAPSFFSMTQYAPELFWDGRAGDQFIDPQFGNVSIATGGALESQAVGPIVSSAEMGHDGRTWNEVIAKLEQVTPLRMATNVPPDMTAALAIDADYPALFDEAFGDSAITAERIGFAIATYERTLLPDQTPWDLYEAGDLGAMTPGQIAGLTLLTDSTVCFNCHQPPMFTDNLFWNIGLRPASDDTGRMAVTGDPADNGRFKTPSLRNSGLRPAMMHVGWLTDVQDVIDFYNAPAFPLTGVGDHTQYTADQTGIPTGIPGFFANYQNINMPVMGPGGQPFQGDVIDFISNALTDPRVAAESFPFDRPTLNSELVPGNPELLGPGSPGTGGIEPIMIAVTPLTTNNPDFKLGLGHALGGSSAWLALALGAAAPGTTFKGGVPLAIDATQLLITLLLPLPGGAAGDGFLTVLGDIEDNPAAVGLELFAQWFVQDAAATGGLAATPGVRWPIL
jgi:cytochrome c peroxidase